MRYVPHRSIKNRCYSYNEKEKGLEDEILSKEQRKDKQSNSGEALRAIAYFSHIGVTMAACVFVGVLLGKYIDGLLGTSPWLLLIFSMLGVGAAIRSIFRLPKGIK